MLKQFILLLSFLASTIILRAQYYYSDILSTQLANSNYLTLKQNKVKKVVTKNNVEEDIILITQTFSTNWNSLITESQLSIGQTNSSTSTYINNLIVRKTEEGKNVNSEIVYNYAVDGKLLSIQSSSIDTSINKGFNETHSFNYDENGILNSMFKIKNNLDTTFIEFRKDEKGNVIEEIWNSKKNNFATYYYYYNEKNLLTDIVKFNLKANRMLPEFLFENNNSDKLISMTQIPYGSSNYFIWKYYYNEKGLKTSETCANKNSVLLGKMEYNYSY